MAANLIQNGNFTNSLYPWTAETGWTWSQNGGGSAQQYKYQNTKLYQNFNTETGASYKVTFNVLYMPVSTVNVGFKNANGDMVGVASFQGSGWKTFDFEAEIVANQIAFWLTSSGQVLAIIDTVSVVQIAAHPLIGNSLTSNKLIQKGLV